MTFRVVRSLVVCLLAAGIPAAAFSADYCAGTNLQAPLAVDDSRFITAVGTRIDIPVLMNDLVDPTGTLVIDGVTLTQPALGTVSISADRKVISYTPQTLADYSFHYQVHDVTQTGLQSEAEVLVNAPTGEVDVTYSCTNGVCAFTATPRNPAGIRAYRWTWGDLQPEPPGKVYFPNEVHVYNATGTYRVTVTVDYYSGESLTGRIDCPVTFAAQARWDEPTAGLNPVIENIRGLETFPQGTRVFMNWSPIAGDCAVPESFPPNYNLGCGRVDASTLNFVELQCTTTCRAWTFYSHTGTYAATLRFQPPSDGNLTTHGDDPVEYKIFIAAQNQAPVVTFNATRPDPNVREYSFSRALEDDGPFPSTNFAWDFGDGNTFVEPDVVSLLPSHKYGPAGTYRVAVSVRDADGLEGVVAHDVEVTNAPPVPGIRVNCKTLDCTFGSELSVDDGNIASWSWDFGEAVKVATSGATVTKHYAAAGCYDVTLAELDEEGLSGTAHRVIPVGKAAFASAGGAVVDAHVQSYLSSQKWFTTNGNLNGILEPGETVVVEPQWHATATAAAVPVLAQGWTTTDWSYATPSFVDFVPSYDLSGGTSDCWAAGRCYGVKVIDRGTGRGANAHNDISFNETYLSTGLPTPGSPVRIHVGKSFTDVPTGHWAYGAIESVLHAGIDGGCNGLQFCPGTVVTRGEAAKWMMLAEHGANWQPAACAGAGPFTDVPCSHPYAPWIAQLKAEGITAGTSPGMYSPGAALARGELAVFLLRTKLGAAYAPPACTADYSDVPCPSGFASWISDLKTRGVSTGCGPYLFCPGDAADRAQTAVLTSRMFGISLDTRACPSPIGYDIVPSHTFQPAIVSISFNPSKAVMGSTATATITLGVAPTAAVSIPLRSDQPSVATVPASVLVNAGQTTGTFAVTPGSVTQRTTAQITATFLEYAKTVPLDVCTRTPSIVTQPTARVINLGQTTTLTAAASTGSDLTYQWFTGTPQSGTPVPTGGTASSYSASPTTTTTYFVRVSNSCGAFADSATAQVYVCRAPAITGHPAGETIATGASATLHVDVTGDGSYLFQWFEGTSGTTTKPIAGATGATFMTGPLTSTTSYWVRVTSGCNAAWVTNSGTATVTVSSQIARRQRVTGTASSQTSVSATWPTATQAGSLLVAVISASNNTYPIGNFTPPAGWQLANAYEWNNVRTAIYYYPNNPGARQQETFAINGFRDQILQLAEYVGAAAASPLDRTAVAGAASSSGTVTTGTTPVTVQAKELVITALTTYARTGFTSPTSNFLEVDDTSSGNVLTTAVHERMVLSTGAYGHSASVAGTAQWIGLVATFRSADTTAATSEVKK
jgi:hypothetical protein